MHMKLPHFTLNARMPIFKVKKSLNEMRNERNDMQRTSAAHVHMVVWVTKPHMVVWTVTAPRVPSHSKRYNYYLKIVCTYHD